MIRPLGAKLFGVTAARADSAANAVYTAYGWRRNSCFVFFEIKGHNFYKYYRNLILFIFLFRDLNVEYRTVFENKKKNLK